jgi:DNA-binding NarL/FixJ family response regulator
LPTDGHSFTTDEGGGSEIPSRSQYHSEVLHWDGCIVEELTERELEVLDHVANGLRNREIARRLHITNKTVEFHLANIFGKLGVSTRTGAVVRAMQLGWLGLSRTRADDGGGRREAGVA